MAKTIFATESAPVKQRVVDNGKGYFDLVLNKNRNGVAIRIADRFNGNRVHVSLASLDDFINALTQVRDNGIKMSVEEIQYDQAA